MKQHKMTFLLLTGALLTIGLSACTQDQPKQGAAAKASTEASAEPAVAKASTEPEVPADVVAHDVEPSAADWKAKLQVKMALLEKLGTDSLHVDVMAHEGDVRLSGTVEKRETRELAATIAKSIPAVTSVRNDIRLESNLDNPNKAGVAAGEAEAELKDTLLSTKVRMALVDGLGSDGFRIGTEVASGVVTLEFAPELAATRRAEALKAAQGVEGVSKVVSVEKTRAS
jgi:osmotically-inducible protein OsmY